MKLDSSRRHQLNPNRPRAAGGFTLVEMLLVLVILGVLAAIVVPGVLRRGDEARYRATVTQISTLRTALSTYEIDNGHFPGTQGGLNELIQRPPDAPQWRGPYLDPPYLPKDGWRHDFAFVCPGRNNPDSYDLSSAGRDGIFGTEDDITSWLPND